VIETNSKEKTHIFKDRVWLKHNGKIIKGDNNTGANVDIKPNSIDCLHDVSPFVIRFAGNYVINV
jgi:hypothetical protein